MASIHSDAVGAASVANPQVADPSSLALSLDISENDLPVCAGQLHQRTIPDGSEVIPTTLFECARTIMMEPDVFTKAKLTFVACAQWAKGGMPLLPTEAGQVAEINAPDTPARPSFVVMVSPGKLNSGGKKGMVHSIVALDEAKHFSMWAQRLVDLGSAYGDLKGHDGLWQSATETSKDILARLVIVHMVHEARGLDVTPNMLKKLAKSSDTASETILRANYAEEITHVGAGAKWFVHIAKQRHHTEEQLPELFKGYVKQFFKGGLKPPFNAEARGAAGMPPSWYEPVAAESTSGAQGPASAQA